MALIVEPTLPYSPSQLKLDDPSRWSRLYSLIRPSLRSFTNEIGQPILIDTALSESPNVHIAAIGNAGNLSSKILSGPGVTALATQPFGKESDLTAEDVIKAMRIGGVEIEKGLVILRVSNGQQMNSHVLNQHVSYLELFVRGESKMDHVLSLLLAAKPEVKSSMKATTELLETYLGQVARTTSKFHESKKNSKPTVIHSVDISEFNSAKASVCKDLSHVFSSRPDPGGVVYSVHYSDINGLSRLENYILAHEISVYLEANKIPSHISYSTVIDSFSTSRGWTISICPIPARFLDPQAKPTGTLHVDLASKASPSATPSAKVISSIHIDPTVLRKTITSGCENLIRYESTITEYDTIVGDGDCGFTLRDGAKTVLTFLRSLDDTTLINFPSVLSALVDKLEVEMGGTSGALYCIFLSSLSHSMRTSSSLPEALDGALAELLKYTSARKGDRTCLDCLISFVENLKEGTGDEKVVALQAARQGVEGTKGMEAKLGRSSYLDESATKGVPDPGAYGLLMLLEGMAGSV